MQRGRRPLKKIIRIRPGVYVRVYDEDKWPTRATIAAVLKNREIRAAPIRAAADRAVSESKNRSAALHIGSQRVAAVQLCMVAMMVGIPRRF